MPPNTTQCDKLRVIDVSPTIAEVCSLDMIMSFKKLTRSRPFDELITVILTLDPIVVPY